MKKISEVLLSLEHIRVMKHALGLTKDRFKNKNYLAYRNYYTAPLKEPVWEDLVDIGFAMRLGHERKDGTNDFLQYLVTPRGLKYLGGLFEMTIND